jgi:formyl-CoA transferase
MPPLPLSPYSVLDLTTGRSGPTAVRQLADWGARAIHIDAPSSSSAADQLASPRRRLPEPAPQQGERHPRPQVERGPRDLHAPRRSSRRAHRELPPRSDQSGWASVGTTVHARNPRVVYGSISGFGQTGPYANRPASIRSRRVQRLDVGDRARRPRTSARRQRVADSSSGSYLACGVLTALLERERTGVGRWVRTSLLESIIALMDFQAARWLVDGVCPDRRATTTPRSRRWVSSPRPMGSSILAPAGGEMFRKFCDALEVSHLPRCRVRRSAQPCREPRRAQCVDRRAARASARSPSGSRSSTRPAIPCGPILTVSEMWRRRTGAPSSKSRQHDRIIPTSTRSRSSDSR